MQPKLSYSLACVLLLAGFACAIQLKAKFYPKRLGSMSTCEDFSRQTQFLIAKAEVYYNQADHGFYLDPEMKLKFTKCCEYHKKNTKQQLSSIIYKIRNVNEFNKDVFYDMEQLEGVVDAFIEVIPVVMFFLGPGSNRSETAQSNIDGLATSWAVVKPSEKENRNTFYPQEFFNQLGVLQANLKVANKYMMLNGWHLRNMPIVPDLSRNLLDVYSGVIIYVERKHAHYIGKNEVVRFLNGSNILPVWFDMPGSPEIAGAGQLRIRAALVVVGLLCLRWAK